MLLPMPGNEKLAAELSAAMSVELGVLETRRFPDEESYVRIATDVRGKEIDIVCTLARPDRQFLGLVFAANTARELGARSVSLIAPYLSYMRQDKRFKDGEAVTSTHFARLLSQTFDRLVTVDPHLHRRHDLGEIFSIPTIVTHAVPLLADWIRDNVQNPFVIGPDSESEQWVSAVASRANAPYIVLNKHRHGDRQVEIVMPDLSEWRDKRPVLIDDIISSGRTMIETAQQVVMQDMPRPYCLGVHAIFAGDSYKQLAALSERVISTDAVLHPSNGISIVPLIAPVI